jgi:carbon storage regulator CsrA
MLIIQRRLGERIVISNGVEIMIAAVTKRAVRLAVRAPNGIVVIRGEVHDAVAAANAAAGETSLETSDPQPIAHPRRRRSCRSQAPDSAKLKSTTRA